MAKKKNPNANIATQDYPRYQMVCADGTVVTKCEADEKLLADINDLVNLSATHKDFCGKVYEGAHRESGKSCAVRPFSGHPTLRARIEIEDGDEFYI